MIPHDLEFLQSPAYCIKGPTDDQVTGNSDEHACVEAGHDGYGHEREQKCPVHICLCHDEKFRSVHAHQHYDANKN